jgi:hypothetical protein
MATLSTSSNPGQADIFLSEAQGQRSRDNAVVTMAANVALPSGSLLTKSGAKYVKYAGGATACDAVLITKLPAQAAVGDVKAAVFARDCEINASGLTGSDANAVTKLALAGVIVRASTGLAGTY